MSTYVNTMWQITDDIFLGTGDDARDMAALQEAGITHIVNCAEELPCYFPAGFTCLPLYLSDPDAYFSMRIAALGEFIDAARETGNTLIHCNGGVSRSPACLLAYLCHCGLSLPEAAYAVKEKVQTRPNLVFITQIADFFGRSLTEEQAYGILEILAGP